MGKSRKILKHCWKIWEHIPAKCWDLDCQKMCFCRRGTRIWEWVNIEGAGDYGKNGSETCLIKSPTTLAG